MACNLPIHASLLIILTIVPISISTPSSSISIKHPLSRNSTILSHHGTFTLGFFSPSNSSNFYLGIWYTIVSSQTPVWVANRNSPLSNPASSELLISESGNLVLLDHSKALIWSTNITSPHFHSTTAELLDSGNLILRDTQSSGTVLWESFDHPTDTWLPGGKLGKKKRAGEVQKLVSWRNSADPSPGIFSLEIDPDGSSEYFLLWNSSVVYWSSGLWNGKIFSNVPEMVPGYIYDFSFISNDEEAYFTYNTTLNSSVVSRFVVDVSGQIKQVIWVSGEWVQFWSQPRKQCEVYRLCGKFGVCRERMKPHCSCAEGFEEGSMKEWSLGDLSAGCVRKTRLSCRGDDRFLAMENVRVPGRKRERGVEDCEGACLEDCSCSGYSVDGGCKVWIGALYNLEEGSEEDEDGVGNFYLRVAGGKLQSPERRKKTAAEIGVGGGAAVVVVVIALWVVWRRRRKRLSELRLVESSLVCFKYSELKRMTRNFSEKLGGGGFGSVFRGRMEDSKEVAVKKLEGIGQGEKEFRSEVCTIGMIQHVNLVRLLGFCSDRSRKLLVYDYMPGGSLDRVLFKNNSGMILGWRTRYEIMLGIARGLVYLHENCRDCIIHCDIKPENILLDGNLVPKIADFGMAKLVGRDFSRVLTTTRGTRGYLAPEWIYGGAITAKADVYSFGMMLFEIISGMRNSDEQEDDKKYTFFPAFAAKKLTSGEVLDLLDQKMQMDANKEELVRVLRLAFWCAQEDEAPRPSMSRVVQILENAQEIGNPPIPRYFQLLWENPSTIVNFYGGADASEQFSGDPAGEFSATSQTTSRTSSCAHF